MKTRKLPSQKYLREAFDYDPKTGVLTWRERPLSHFKSERIGKGTNTRYAGKRAGVEVELPKPKGYRLREVGVAGVVWEEHRVIWKWMTGRTPTVIDHKNRNAADNRWGNLREVSRCENNRNSSIRSNNTSGFCGVSQRARTGKWRAYYSHNSERRYLGDYRSKEDAHSAVLAARLEDGYTLGHGTERPV